MEESKNAGKANREIKASVFTALFGEPQNAAQLYAALDGVETVPEDIHFTTLEGVLFMARKNDLAFTVRQRVLIISEHQSTLNQNMPLRDVIYYGRTLEQLIEKTALYRNRLIPIPTPEFYVFYNGDKPYPLEKTLKLSDAYLEKTAEPMLELKVKVININLPENHSLLQKCRPLYEYSWFIQRVREYRLQGQERDKAIIHAIEDCEREGILADFVQKHGSEAVNMLFTQFNIEDAKKISYEEGREEGLEKGRREGIMGKLIEQVCRKLQKEKTPEEIAEELEEDEEMINKICIAVEKCGPNSDIKRVYRILEGEE